MKGFIVGSLITVFTTTQLLATVPVLPPFSGITQSTTHAITIDNNSDSSFQFTLSPGGAYDILPNYGYQIPVTPNTQFNLAAVRADQTTSTTTPRVDYAETTEALSYSSAPTSMASAIAGGVYGSNVLQSIGYLATNIGSGRTLMAGLGAFEPTLTMTLTNLTLSGACRTASGEGWVEIVLWDATQSSQIWSGFMQGIMQAGVPLNVSLPGPLDLQGIASTWGAMPGDILQLQAVVQDIVGTNAYDVGFMAVEQYP